MEIIKNYRIRKCSDINRDSPLYEILSEENKILMIILRLEQQTHVLFDNAIIDKALPGDLITEILQEVEKLFTNEEN